jgi:hypothetical protein
VKEENKRELNKYLKILITDFFYNHANLEYFYASAIDIKSKFYSYDNRISNAWLYATLKKDMKLTPLDITRYIPFEEPVAISKTGRPYKFLRANFITENEPQELFLKSSNFPPF